MVASQNSTVWILVSMRSFTLRYPDTLDPPTDQKLSTIGVMLLGLFWI